VRTETPFEAEADSFTPVAPPELPEPLADYDTFVAAVKRCAEEGHAATWRLADLLVIGETYHFHDDDIPNMREFVTRDPDTGCFKSTAAKYRRSFYKEMAAITGMAVQTLKNLASLARTFPPESRDSRLSPSFYATLAPVQHADPQRAEMLVLHALAQPEGRATVEWLKREIDTPARAERRRRKAAAEPTATDDFAEGPFVLSHLSPADRAGVEKYAIAQRISTTEAACELISMALALLPEVRAKIRGIETISGHGPKPASDWNDLPIMQAEAAALAHVEKEVVAHGD
jgi:hypothetical protein